MNYTTARVVIFLLLVVAAHVYAFSTVFYHVVAKDFSKEWRVVAIGIVSPVLLAFHFSFYILFDKLSQELKKIENGANGNKYKIYGAAVVRGVGKVVAVVVFSWFASGYAHMLPNPALIMKLAAFFGISDLLVIIATIGDFDFGLAGAFASVVLSMQSVVSHRSKWVKFASSVSVPVVIHMLCPIMQLLSSDATGPASPTGDKESWDKGGEMYVKLANYLLELDSKYEAADAYANAAHCYKMTNSKESIPCLEQSVNIFLGIEMPTVAAIYYQELAELYEQEQNVDEAIVCYEIAANQFQIEEMTTLANHCKQKIAQFAALVEQYPKAIEIYEEIARRSLNDNLLKYEVKGHLLNADICQLCRGDVVAISNALERYQELDPTFSGTREYKLLAVCHSSRALSLFRIAYESSLPCN